MELFQPLDLSRIPNAARLVPAFCDAPRFVRDGQTHGIPMIRSEKPCVFDPARRDAMPPRYADFAKAESAGEPVLLDDPFGSISLGATSPGFPEPSRLRRGELDGVIKALMAVKPKVMAMGSRRARWSTC